MKVWIFFTSGFSLEVGLADWMVLGYICALIPIIILLVVIPRVAIFFDEIRVKIQKSNQPLVFAYDLQEHDKN